MTNKILNDVDLGRISLAINELRSCKTKPAQKAFKSLDKWLDVIETLVEGAKDLHEETVDILMEALLDKRQDPTISEEEYRELEFAIKMFEVLR